MSPSTYGSFGDRRKRTTSQPSVGKRMVRNNSGAYVFQLGDFDALQRFLLLGTEGGSFYLSEKQLTADAAKKTIACIAQDGRKAVDMIVAISDAGRAPKNDPAIFALALAAADSNPDTRTYALSKLHLVCRIPTHLFHFVTYVQQFRGWGRGLKRAVADWYQRMPTDKLAYELIKYQNRDGWRNGDVLRLAHPKPDDQVRSAIYKYALKGVEGVHDKYPGIDLPDVIGAFELAKDAPNKELIKLIEQYNLTREMLPTEALNDADVWDALLQRMPLTALIRNLGNMSKVGLLRPLSDAAKLVKEKLLNREQLKKARIHPISILIAMKVYEAGHGVLGKGEWKPVPSVVNALNDAFYLAFDYLEPTGKRFLYAIDVSGSMTWSAISPTTPITPAEAAAALALACAKTEEEHYIMGFAEKFRDLGITPRMRLDEALKQTAAQTFGGTDCSVPLVWARENKINVDCFVTLTDSETNGARKHPHTMLTQYRADRIRTARQIVVGMTATDFTIADPNDPLSLDIAGFDSSIPGLIQEFVR